MSIDQYKIINPNIKRLYAFLKRYKIERFLLKEEFTIALMELNVDTLWDNIHKFIIRKSEIAVFSPNYTGYVDEAFPFFINYIYLKNTDDFLILIDYIIHEFVVSEKLKKFNYEVLYERIVGCDVKLETILSKMSFLSSKLNLQKVKTKIKKEDIKDLVKRMVEAELIILDGIDPNKYDDIIEQYHIIGTCYKWIFITENILRKFIIQILSKLGISEIRFLKDSKLTKKINNRTNDEKNRRYLPIRGNHDIYYLDLIDLNRIFQNHWEYFKDHFDSQGWICQRIADLYAIRVRVAHNSSNLSQDELISVTAYCKEIIKQIDPYT